MSQTGRPRSLIDIIISVVVGTTEDCFETHFKNLERLTKCVWTTMNISTRLVDFAAA